MKRTVFSLFALVLIGLPVNLVAAQSLQEQTQTQSEQPNLQDRIQQRKEKFNLTLETAKTDQLKTKCKAAQGKLQSASKRIQGIRTSRSETYNNLTSRLNTAKDKLAESNIDTKKLGEAMSKLVDAIVTYKTTMTAYQTAVDDSSVLDCEQDPEAFWVSVTEARELVGEIDEIHQQIKDTLKNEIKPQLVDLRKQLGASEKTDQVEGSDGTE